MSRDKLPDPERLAVLLSGDRLHEPPAGTLRRAIALAARLGERPAGLAAWVARLLFDSAASPLPAGLRGGAGNDRRLLYQLDPARPGDDAAQVALRLRRDADGTLEITGQFLPPPAGASVTVRAGKVSRTGPVGAIGEFAVRGLSARATKIRLTLDVPGREPVTLDAQPRVPRT